MARDDDFMGRAEAFRPELLAHCYRMLGSVQDAEDLVQETMLRAWRARDGFEGRSSLRTWLYRIATNVCLTALEHRARRPMPSGLGTPSTNPEGPWPEALPELAWMQPFPDRLAESEAADPASIVAARAGMRLALVTALQYLHPRQRAALILRDVLGWRAAEVADLLDVSVAAANSLLQRARTRLEAVAPSSDDVAEPSDAGQRALLDRYAAAFEAADIDTLMDLLAEDVVWEMPPQIAWFQGRAAVGRLLGHRLRLHACGSPRARMVPVGANGQAGFGVYFRGLDGVFRPQSVQVVTVVGDHISRVLAFRFPGVFELFGLPEELHLRHAEQSVS